MAAAIVDKQEPTVEGVTSSAKVGDVEVPYSIYNIKEKWLIVGMVALAGFYRYVKQTSSQLTTILTLT
jgi:hypothetical protein